MKFWHVIVCGRGIYVKASSPAIALNRAVKMLPDEYPEVKWLKVFKNPDGVNLFIQPISESYYKTQVGDE